MKKISFSLKNIKKDWWLANSLWWIMSGLWILVAFLLGGQNVVIALISGGINILVGFALLQRSKIAFWITIIMALYTFFEQLSLNVTAAKNNGGQLTILPGFVIAIGILVLAIMLWQEQRKESKG